MQSVSDGSGPQVTSHSLYTRVPKLGWAHLGMLSGTSCLLGFLPHWWPSLPACRLCPRSAVASSSSAAGVLLGLTCPYSSEQGTGMLSEELQPYFESLEAQGCLWRP